MNRFFPLLVSFTLALSAGTTSAHISYSNRNLGTFDVIGTLVTGTNNSGTLSGSGTSSASVTITNQNVTGDSGWADATDDSFGDSHHVRAFRFTLQSQATVTLSVTGLDYVSGMFTFAPLAHPSFSLYQGLAHVSPAAADHDTSAISTSWLDSLDGSLDGNVNYDGAFYALGDWKIGSDDGSTFDDLSSFTYIGNAADGTSANYGSAVGINGDGIADGFVTATYTLVAGDYSLFVGGGNSPGASTASFGIQTVITVVPEPSTLCLVGLVALAGLLRFGRKRPS